MRYLLCLVAAAAATMPVATAQAKLTEPATPEYAYGNPVVELGSEIVTDSFAVVGRPFSLTAAGLYQRHIVDSATALDINIVATIDCLNVVGNAAYMSGTIAKSNRVDIPVGVSFYTSVADNDPEGAVDMIGSAYVYEGAPTCDVTIAPEFVVTSGNVVVGMRGEG